MTVSLDTSVLVSLFVEDTNTPTALAWLGKGPLAIAVSTFAAVEFAAAVGRRVRMGVYDSGRGSALLSVFDTWVGAHAAALEVEPSDHRTAAGFVRRFDLGLRAPDALHIAICHRLRLPLLTFDMRQAAAARQLGVACDPAGAGGTQASRPDRP